MSKNIKEKRIISREEFIERFGGDFRILKKQEYIFTNDVKYQIAMGQSEVCLAINELNTERNLLKLAQFGLCIFQDDAEDVMGYIKNQLKNGEYATEKVTSSIGYVNGEWVNPYDSDYNIISDDPGTKKYFDGFGIKGNIQDWNKKVLQTYKDSPACTFYLISSLASVTLPHFGLSPFIVDINSVTSTGKTTLTEAAISVWGKNNLLVNWNATQYGIEKVAASANNFPIFLDDTKKANKAAIQANIYNFSSGESKTRGNGRTLQQTKQWCNILLSTGEYSILELTKESGGAAARCISLEFDKVPMDKKTYYEFTKSYKENYGVVGNEFLKKWISYTEKDPEFKKNRYMEIGLQLTQDVTNNVLSRLADSFASVILTAELLNEWFDFNINIEQLFMLFNKLCEDNADVDIPKKILVDILTEIDAKRDYLNLFNGNYFLKNDEFHFTVDFINKKLKEQCRIVRKQWLDREFVIKHYNKKGKVIDNSKCYININGKAARLNVISIKLSFAEELGFTL